MTIMSRSRRFYVGNLSTEVKDNDITKLFEKFGAVDKIEIKNKTDVEGNVLTTFAFVSMNEITEDNVAKCIQSTSSSHAFTNSVTTNLLLPTVSIKIAFTFLFTRQNVFIKVKSREKRQIRK